MTVVLIGIIIYLVITLVLCFIASATTMLDTEDFLACLFWIVTLPYVVVEGLARRRKYKKILDKQKQK